MAMELHYTSVPRGLKPGSTGFCTVALTAGMPAPMIQRLESLGGYRPIYDVGHPNESKNPPVFAHWRVNIGGHFYSILSYVGYAGADYQARFNKYAHHLVVDTPEQVPAGPAWVMLQEGVMSRSWSGEPRILPAGSKIMPDGENPLRICQGWRSLAGDAGWAGMLAQAFVLDASKPAYVIYKPGMDMLGLVNEAIALLPERMRWRVTFSTYFDSLPAGIACSWRCCVAGTPAAQAAAANATSGVLIDLTTSLGQAPASKFVQMARTGEPGLDAEGGPQRVLAPAPGRWESTAPPATGEVLARPVEPAAPQVWQADALPQRSFPPPAATPHEEFERPRVPKILVVLAALVWTLLVAGGTWLAHAHLAPKPALAPVQTKDEMKAELDKLSADIETNHKRLMAKEKEIADLKADNDKLQQDLAKQADQASGGGEKVRILQKKLEDAEQKLRLISEQLKLLESQKPVQPSTTAPQASPAATAVVAKAVGGAMVIAAGPVLKMENLGPMPQEEKWELPAPEGAVALRLKFAGSLPPPLRFEDKPGGKAEVLYADEKEPFVIAQVELADGKISGRWRGGNWPIRFRGDVTKLRQALQAATLEVLDKDRKKLSTYQFNPPLEDSLEVGQAGEPKRLQIAWALEPRLLLAEASAGWTMELDKEGREATIKSASGIKLKVELSAGEGGQTTVASTWGGKAAPANVGVQLPKVREKVAVATRQVEKLTQDLDLKDRGIRIRERDELKPIQDEIAGMEATQKELREKIHKHKGDIKDSTQGGKTLLEIEDKIQQLRDKAPRKDGHPIVKSEPWQEADRLYSAVIRKWESESPLKELVLRASQSAERIRLNKEKLARVDKEKLDGLRHERDVVRVKLANQQSELAAVQKELNELEQQQTAIIQFPPITLQIAARDSQAVVANLLLKPGK